MERINQYANSTHRQHDDWDEVHNQLLAIQKKSLEVSNPGDTDEKEADEVVRKVVDRESAEIQGTDGTINRKGEGNAEASPEFQSKLESNKGNGQSLDDSTKSEMESKMGADFSGVKIHTGTQAHDMSESINAKAFTHAQDVFFKDGQFDTNSKQGKELLAHELTHTVQQGSNKIQPKIQRESSDSGDINPISKTPEQDLADIKSGYYNNAYSLKYEAARRVMIASYANQIVLAPDDEKLLKSIVGDKEGENELGQKRHSDYQTKKAGTFDAEAILTSAMNILKCDSHVKDTLLFFSQIKSNYPPDQWDSELEKFFTGDRKPTIQIIEMGYTGNTPGEDGSIPSVIEININNDFPAAVSTFLHELNHYIDLWYSSDAATADNAKRERSEYSEGVTPFKTNSEADKNKPGDVDPVKGQQVSALSEYLTAILPGIINDMQQPSPQPYEHVLVPELRKEYFKWLSTAKVFHKRPFALNKAKQRHIKKITRQVEGKMLNAYGPIYNEDDSVLEKRWGLDIKDDQISNTGVEMGFAFDKAAYGFYNESQKPGKWAENFNEKFEKQYWPYL